MTTTTEPVQGGPGPGIVAMDAAVRIRIPRGGAIAAAILRIGIGLIYLWAFIAQGFGIGYTNHTENPDVAAPTEVHYEWDFTHDSDAGAVGTVRGRIATDRATCDPRTLASGAEGRADDAAGAGGGGSIRNLGVGHVVRLGERAGSPASTR